MLANSQESAGEVTLDGAGPQPAADARGRESVAALLRSHGVTPTHQRIEIANVLFERKRHLSADQILALANARHAETSKATVYNTLKLFLEKKLIRELIVDPNKVFYDPNVVPHHHFYDVATGELIDFPSEGVRLEGVPPLPDGAVEEGVDIIVRVRSTGARPDR